MFIARVENLEIPLILICYYSEIFRYFLLDKSLCTFLDSRKSSDVRGDDIRNLRHRMSRLTEDFDGEEAASREQNEEDAGLVNILNNKRTLRSSITSENQIGFDTRRENFRKKGKRSFEKYDSSLNECIEEEDINMNGTTNVTSSESFDEIIPGDSDTDSSDDKNDQDCIRVSNIYFENNEVLYPTLSKSRKRTSFTPEMEFLQGRNNSVASSDSTPSDDEHDFRRSESFASFGSSIKLVQQRQVINKIFLSKGPNLIKRAVSEVKLISYFN